MVTLTKCVRDTYNICSFGSEEAGSLHANAAAGAGRPVAGSRLKVVEDRGEPMRQDRGLRAAPFLAAGRVA